MEALGYDVVLVADHFRHSLAALPALAAAAVVTTRLRLGTMVWANDFHRPVETAKQAATVDALSGGRLELGIGSGWMPSEYEQIDEPYDRGGVRLERLEEAIEVIRALWGPGPADFAGAHYTLRSAEIEPKPAQRPGPPILVGAGGRRGLGLAGRQADVVNFSMGATPTGQLDLTDIGAASFTRKVGWLAEAAGDRFADIELSVLAELAVTDDPVTVAEAVLARTAPTSADVTALGSLEVADVLDSPHHLIGSVAEIAERCLDRRDRWGLSYLVVREDGLDGLVPVMERLATEAR